MDTANITVVCIRPQGSGNLGSIARVMKNFGFRDLVLVAPRCGIDAQSFRMACHAADILRDARTVEDLAALDSEFHGYIGTSGKLDPSIHGEPIHPAGLPEALSRVARQARLALLLGPEDHGLSNAELKRCRWIVRIPADPEYPSLNIAQAAAILLYELGGRGRPLPEPSRAVRVSTAGEMEQLFAQLRRLLLDAGFLHQDNPERIMYPLRRLLFRAGPEEREVRILRGILRQLGWAFRQAGFPPGQDARRDPGESDERD
jgi:TrmH family RNA methyltransferase